MLDQTFSAENFRKIFDEENRKGVDLASKYFPSVQKINSEIKSLNLQLKNLKSTGLAGDEFRVKKKELKSEINLLKDKKEQLLINALENLVDNLEANSSVKLHKVDSLSSKTVYKIANDATNYFVVKQLQKNIHKLYKVKQSNRHEIVIQLFRLLDNKFPNYLIRTDINGLPRVS